MKRLLSVLALLLVLVGCSSSKPSTENKVIKVASHIEPMTTVVELAKTELEKAGYTLELVTVTDNSAANIALNNKEVDANFFQHVPFMTMFNEANKGTLVGITPIYNAIVGFYSKNYDSMDALPEGATIAIPNDSVNQARALRILDEAGYITLDPAATSPLIKDIKESKYEFKEVDLLTLSQAYDEVDLVFNYPTYIGKIGLKPKTDGLLLESASNVDYAISLVAREDNKDSEEIKALKEAMTSEAVREFLTNETNSQTLVPSF